jgi:hypothetical protein
MVNKLSKTFTKHWVIIDNHDSLLLVFH